MAPTELRTGVRQICRYIGLILNSEEVRLWPRRSDLVPSVASFLAAQGKDPGGTGNVPAHAGKSQPLRAKPATPDRVR